MSRFISFVFLGLVLAFACVGQACTTFVLCDGDALFLGKNFDYYVGDGLVIANQPGVAKIGMVPPSNMAVWTSRYGSVTFNQFGWELPIGGMNEVGLVVETMQLPETRYPPSDKRAAISYGQWVQYQLDNCETVDEVIATNKKIRIVGEPNVKMGLHFLVADATGTTALIEFLEGKMVCHSGPDLPLKASTNLPYKECLAYVETGDGDASKSHNSLPRFLRASTSVKEFDSEIPTADRDYAFKTLDSVSDGTLWSIVYDIANQKVYYRTDRNPKLRWLSLNDFDFSPEVSPRYLDINGSGGGHVAEQSQDLTPEANAKYVRAFWSKEEVKKIMGGGGRNEFAKEMYLLFLMAFRPKSH